MTVISVGDYPYQRGTKPEYGACCENYVTDILNVKGKGKAKVVPVL